MPSMSEPMVTASQPPRVPTGIPGLDLILRGGLFRGGVYIVMGRPGTGKTILANQIAFSHVEGGGRAVYATLLSETHGRLLAFLQNMTFYKPDAVGESIAYVNGYTSTEADGLAGLMLVVRGEVREHKATLLVIDGMVTAANVARSDVEYKKFIQELQVWVEMIGCTVLLLASGAANDEVRPEQTMVDGILQLDVRPVGRRRIRQLYVTKFRGSSYLEGQHAYEITEEGFAVYPRLEPAFAGDEPTDVDHKLERIGVPGLDDMLGGGLVRGSTTMIFGASGSGKTIIGQQFLQAGLEDGQAVAGFGFYANPPQILRWADERGLDFRAAYEGGKLSLMWQPSAERLLDKIGWQMLRMVGRTGAKRLFVDSIEALREAEDPDRVSGFFSVLSQELRRLGVTTLFAAETIDNAAGDLQLPVHRLSTVTQNVISLRSVEIDGKLERQIAILKTRNRRHDLRVLPFSIGETGLVIEGPRERPRGPRRR
jgi:circadian clock protein KaiC